MNIGQMDRGNENPTQHLPWWLRKTTKQTPVRLVGTGIRTRVLPNASLVRDHGATSLGKKLHRPGLEPQCLGLLVCHTNDWGQPNSSNQFYEYRMCNHSFCRDDNVAASDLANSCSISGWFFLRFPNWKTNVRKFSMYFCPRVESIIIVFHNHSNITFIHQWTATVFELR